MLSWVCFIHSLGIISFHRYTPDVSTIIYFMVIIRLHISIFNRNANRLLYILLTFRTADARKRIRRWATTQIANSQLLCHRSRIDVAECVGCRSRRTLFLSSIDVDRRRRRRTCFEYCAIFVSKYRLGHIQNGRDAFVCVRWERGDNHTIMNGMTQLPYGGEIIAWCWLTRR